MLEVIGVSAQIRPANVDESAIPGETANALVLRLARLKSAAPQVNANDVVIGSDTVVVVDGQILGKPEDAAHAKEMLGLLSGRSHQVITAVAVRCGRRVESGVSVTDVAFRPLSEADIEWYVATGEPFDKAGSYAIQGAGALFVTEIAGNYSGVVGLPVPLLDELMARVGRPLSTWMSN